MKFFILMQHLSVALFIATMGSVAQAKSLAHDSSYQVQDEVLAEILQLIHHEETSAEEITSLLQLLHEQYPEVYALVTSNIDVILAGDHCYHCETQTKEDTTTKFKFGAFERETTTYEYERVCYNDCDFN